MGIIGKILRRGDKSQPFNLKESIVVSQVQGEAMRGDSETEVAWRQNLGKYYEALHDEDYEAIMAHKVLRDVFIPKTTEDGQIEYLTRNGEIICDAKGIPIPQFIKAAEVDDNFAAIAVINSPVNRQVFLSHRDKKLAQLYAEDIVETTKMCRPEKDFELGFGNFLDSQYYYNFLLLNDCENGNKVKTLFEIRKTQRIEFGPEGKEKKGIF